MHLGSEGRSRKQLGLAGVASWLQVHISSVLSRELCQRVLFLLGKPDCASCLSGRGRRAGRTLRNGFNGLSEWRGLVWRGHCPSLSLWGLEKEQYTTKYQQPARLLPLGFMQF